MVSDEKNFLTNKYRYFCFSIIKECMKPMEKSGVIHSFSVSKISFFEALQVQKYADFADI